MLIKTKLTQDDMFKAVVMYVRSKGYIAKDVTLRFSAKRDEFSADVIIVERNCKGDDRR